MRHSLQMTRRLTQAALGSATVFLVAFGTACSDRASDEPRWTVLRNVTLIDGTGAPPVADQALVIREDRIAEVGPTGSTEVPKGAAVIDLDGKFVVPGFVDLHVHLPEDPRIQAALLARCLEYGVTTILNPGARPGAGVELRKRLREGQVLGPQMFTAGPILERFDDEDALGEDGFRDWAVHVDSEPSVRHAVRAQVESGVDFVKLYRRMTPELVAVAVDEAAKHGVPVIGHLGATTWCQGAQIGVSMLVHSGWGTPMEELVDLADPDSATDTEWYRAYGRATEGRPFAALVRLLVERDVVVVPTLAITMASGLGEDSTLLPRFRVDLAPDSALAGWWTEGWRERHPQYGPDSEEEAEMMRTVYFPAVLSILKGYHEGGVNLGVGTDVGNAWIVAGFSYHLELQLFQEAGIAPLEILRLASRNGAAALGIEDEIGTLEVGKRADLVVLKQDPSEDIRNTRSIDAVYLAGSRVSQLR